jgi:hypothetical protein
MTEEKKSRTQAPKKVEVAILPKDENSVPRQYANFTRVIHSPFDFTLTFCDVPALEEGSVEVVDGKGIVEVPVVARICCPHSLIPNLIEALKKQHEAYLKLKRLELGREEKK